MERFGTPEEIFESDFIERLFDIDEKNFYGNEKLLTYMKQMAGYDNMDAKSER